MDRRVIARIPNWLTIARLVATPLLVALLHDPTRWMVIAAAIVFVVAAITDLLDGYIARRWGAVSDFGSLIDPLADKLLVMTALVMLLGQRDVMTGETLVPAWIVVVILAREIWVTGLRGIAASEGVVLAADTLGKWKSMLQMVAIPLLLLHDTKISVRSLVVSGGIVGLVLIVLSIILSLWSGVEYTIVAFSRRNRPKEEGESARRFGDKRNP